MIHNTFLIRISTKEVLASTKYWPVDIPDNVLQEFVTTREELHSGQDVVAELALTVSVFKFHAKEVIADVLLVFVTDKEEDESSIFEKIDAAKKTIKRILSKSGLEKVCEHYERLIEPSIITRLKIALVGEGGVGKTTTLNLLLGETPPLQYVPTIALNLETVENIRFGNYSLVLWDFAGQERFRTLWRFYFHGADVIFLVCDSTLRNVIISKDILKLIKRDAPKVPVFAMANKQDKPNAMNPEVVQKILGIPTFPMVAIDKDRRDEMLRILMNAAAQYVGIALPDLPASELLKFTDQATEEAIVETGDLEDLAEEAASDEEEEDEYETVIEEVLVDEDGHIIENLEDYEIVEEFIEEVTDDEAEEEFEEVEEVVEAEELEEEEIEELAAEEIPVEQIEEEIEVEVSKPVEPVIVEAPEVEFDEEPTEVGEIKPIELVPSDVILPEPEVLGAVEEDIEFDIPTLSVDELLPDSAESLSIEVEDEVSITTEIEKDEIYASAEIDYDIGLSEVTNEHDVRMAKEIIFEALEADDIISAEIDRVPHEELDEALEAFGSDEALPTDEEEEELPDVIDKESLEELESILGPLDKAVGGTRTEKKDEEHLPIDNESLKELSDLLDFVESDEDEY